MNKTIIILFTFILLLTSFISATGFCKNDKISYHNGESISFECSCTSSTEQNKDGFIVFKNNNGTIIQSIIINSNSCKNDFFGDSFLISGTGSNITGITYFSLNADGTGIPTNWGNVDDIISDNFSIDDTSITDCLISTDHIIEFANLNRWNGASFLITDQITNQPLVHAACSGKIFAADGTPLISVPYGVEHNAIRTDANGKLIIFSQFDTKYWKPNQTYEFEISCHCINGTDEACYGIETGLDVGFKTCSMSSLLTTGEDYRTTNPTTYLIVFGSVLVMIAAMLYGAFNSKNEHIRGVLTYIAFGCIPLILQLSKTILELNNGNTRVINIIWTLEWVSMIVFLFLLIYLFIQFMISVLEKFNNGKG